MTPRTRGGLAALAVGILPAVGCPLAPPELQIVAEDLDAGALLAAWSQGDDLLMVGGHLGAGTGSLARLSGDSLCVEEDVTDRALWWLHGADPSEYWAVGEGGTVLHVLDGERTREDLPTDATLFGVWDDGDSVWAVGGSFTGGGHGEVWVRREGTWTPVAEDLPAVVFKVWDGWFVGDGAAWRLGPGDALAPVNLGGHKLLTVRGRGPDDVWAVGGYATAAVTRGGPDGWDDVGADGLDQALNGVWTAPGEAVWVAGMRGLVAWTDDGAAWELPEERPTTADLHAAWKHGDDVYFVGGNLLSSQAKRGAILRYGLPGAGPLTPEPCP